MWVCVDCCGALSKQRIVCLKKERPLLYSKRCMFRRMSRRVHAFDIPLDYRHTPLFGLL